MKSIHYHKDSHDIVTLTMDMDGSVNIINAVYVAAFSAILDRLEAEIKLVGVVITSAKETFLAGGDIKDLHAVTSMQKEKFVYELEITKSLQRRLEKLPVPVVAAINGAALGGGLEIALSCQRRIGVNTSTFKLGFPEITLGLLPGMGGVVRLTYMLGLKAALPYLLEGRILNAKNALESGMIDELVDSIEMLVPTAKQWILNHKGDIGAALQPWDYTSKKDGAVFIIPGGNFEKQADFICIESSALHRNTRGLLPAPTAILNVAVQALRVDFETALLVESREFANLVVRPETKNLMMSNFFQKRQLQKGDSRPKEIPKGKIKKLGIVGSGMMGQGIAYVAAKADIAVVLNDVSLEMAERAKAYSALLSDKQIKRGISTEAQKKRLLGLISPTDQVSDLDGCDLIIEAVFENMDLKKQVNQQNEQRLAKGGVWATNTSTLPITQLAEASVCQENYIGMHFFSPVDRMRLVEIICGDKTSDKTLAKAFDFVQQIKKTPIVVNDSVGFFSSRVYGMPLAEGVSLVAEGVHPERIEALAKQFGMPVGPLASYDEVSIRLAMEITDTQIAMGLLDPSQDPTPMASKLLRQLLNDYQRGGRRFGGGFYDYTSSGKILWPKLHELYYQPAKDADISDQDIKDRLLFRAVIESLKCLQEGVLRSVADGNIGSLYGIGAPVWTGGYIQFVNSFGLHAFIARCDELAARYGERFQPPKIVFEKAKEGALFL